MKIQTITYRGERTEGIGKITRIDQNGACLLPPYLPIEPSLKIWKHSPTGFEWGYAGSGPAQLALALLLDAGCGEFDANRRHQEFKREVVGRMPRDRWELTSDEVLGWANGNLGEDYFSKKWGNDAHQTI